MIQLLREWPPGYGGVERVAHELGNTWLKQRSSSIVYTLNAKPHLHKQKDPLHASYKRERLPRLRLGVILIPLPSRTLCQLLKSKHELHAHLPCPTVLILATLAKLLQRNRTVTIHWHAFLDTETTLHGTLMGLYQRAALQLMQIFDRVITTSPALATSLAKEGVNRDRIRILPCCLSESQEKNALTKASERREKRLHLPTKQQGLRLISINRLGSYKRVDWLIESFAQAAQESMARGLFNTAHLDIIGDGPHRQRLEQQAQARMPGQINFHGQLNETEKIELLSQADLLVLLSDKCNEAFGIVQLEAMACGVAAVALQLPQSGMAWVSRNSAIPWEGTRQALPALLIELARNRPMMQRAQQIAYNRYLKYFQRERWLLALKHAFEP